MDAPLSGKSQGYGASEVPIAVTSKNRIESSSCEDHYDPDLDSLLYNYFGNYSNSQYFVNDLFKEPSNESASNVCKLQARVYNRSPSLILSYTPPPSAKVLELEYSPDQPLPADVSTPLPAPPVLADVSAPLVMPSRPAIAADLAAPVNMPQLVSPSHFLHADMPSPNMPHQLHLNMPPQQLPPPYPNFQFDPCPNVVCCRGSHSQYDPHQNFTFSIPDVEANHKNQLPYDIAFHDGSQLTAPMSMHHQHLLQNSMKLALPKLEIPTSPITCITSGTASPAYMQSSTFSMADDSDSAAMEISSTSSTPAAQATSNSSFYWTSTAPQRTSLSVPPSPTPSVNRKERRNEGIRRSPMHGLSQVAFKVKTQFLNLDDGFKWKKYGEKTIKGEKYPRSYFKCDEKDRCGCKVLKRTQKSSDNEGCYVVFTYLGRHNHPI